MVAYFAGHGSADTKQFFVLNEDDIDKVFWDAEAQLIKLAKRCGNALKVLVVYDICREPIAITRENVRKFHDEKAKNKVLQI